MIARATSISNATLPAKGKSGASATPTIRYRLLIIGPLPPPFIGPAIATRRLLESRVLAEHFDIDFVDTSDPGGFDGIGRFGWHNVSMAFRHGARCIRALVSRRPDAMYVPIARGLWGFVRDLLFLIPARALGTHVFVHLRAGRFDIIHDHGWLGRAIAKIGLSGVDQALVLGSSVMRVFGDAVPSDRISIVPNGMNLEGWNASAWSLDRASTSGVRIAYIANLYRDKGIHVMIEAMALLKEQSLDVSVTFAGDWGNDPYRLECMSAVDRHGLRDRVHFAGRVDESQTRKLLAASHITAFVPVKPEGLPWVVLEAMSAGLPVIGSPQGTIPEIVIDGETGFIVPSGDADALASRIAKLSNDPQLRERLGSAGRRRVEEHFTEEKAHRQLAAVVLDCIMRQNGQHV